jgi:HK97 family phage major capsid protein
MPNFQELLKQRAFAQSKAESILNAAQLANREMTEAESREFDMATAAVNAINPQIAKIERANTITQHLVNGMLIPAAGNLRQARTPNAPVVLTEDYYNDFYTWLGSRGQQIGAALYEGSAPAGGYAVPIIVDGQVVPLAPTEMGVRTIATVLATASDIKIPTQSTYSTAATKAESGAADNFFTESNPSLNQFTLSAFMSGVSHTCSWELLQDVPTFQNFAVNDLILAIQMLEEGFFVNGTGTGQALGLIGNTGAGVTGVAAGTDTYSSELLAATFDVLGTLNAAYHRNASWLMSRATGVKIRKAQMAANLFAPVWTRENGRDYLHGYPVVFSGSMPSVAATKTPVLFGDFNRAMSSGIEAGPESMSRFWTNPRPLKGKSSS